NAITVGKEKLDWKRTLAAACGKFAPFEIKENMSLAPLCRVLCEDSVLEELDRCLVKPAENLNALKDWIGQKPRQSGPTERRHADTLGECIAVEASKPDGRPDRKRYGAMKLLQFHENYRPAYWGTWRKKSSHISPRCPLRQDKVKLVSTSNVVASRSVPTMVNPGSSTLSLVSLKHNRPHSPWSLRYFTSPASSSLLVNEVTFPRNYRGNQRFVPPLFLRLPYLHLRSVSAALVLLPQLLWDCVDDALASLWACFNSDLFHITALALTYSCE
ncbi:hypothetical protein GOODEAATRI_028225, partial [Goodea atripinnis]